MELDGRLVLGLGLSNSSVNSIWDIDKQPTKRREVAKRLAEIDISYWVGIGSILAKDPSSKVRETVAISLGANGCEEALLILKKLASDGNWHVRYNVALVIKNYNSRPALNIIVKLLSDNNVGVRAAAIKAYFAFRTHNPEMASKLRNINRSDKIQSGSIKPTRKILKNALSTLNGYSKIYDHRPENYAISHVTGKSGIAYFNKIKFRNMRFLIDPNMLDQSRWYGNLNKEKNVVKTEWPSNFEDQPVRNVNSWFTDHPDPLIPLRFGQEYELCIQVGPTLRIGTLTKGKLEFSEPEFGEIETLDAIVAIVTEDFQILDKPAKRMKLPKDLNKESSVVTFRVRPKNNNQEAFITIFFYKGSNLFHEALLGVRVEVRDPLKDGRGTSYFPTEKIFLAPIRGQRDMNIQIIKSDDHFRFVLFYDFGEDKFDVMWCKIYLNQDKVANLISGVRDKLLDVVNTQGALADRTIGRIFYEPDGKPLSKGCLPELYSANDDLYMKSLQTFAKTGRNLYVNLFSSMEGSEEERERTEHVGETLRQLSSNKSMKIQILSNYFFIPWNLLYDGIYPNENVNPYDFWGFKHIIEELPYRTNEGEARDAIPMVEKQLKIGLNVNNKIPGELIEPQLSLVKKLENKAKVFERFKDEEVLTMLRGGAEECQLEYFYCHAGTVGESQKDFDQSYIGLTGTDRGLTLEDIKLSTAGGKFKGNPLFVLNACESAHMNGRFYDGFVPKFLIMGACAVVGTDCELPSLLGAHFGISFLEAFFKGKSIGDILLEERKNFLEMYKNPLGIIYRIFGNADAHLGQSIF